MAITKIGTPELFDFSSLNTALQLPTGNTASRPSGPSTGEWRFNTDLKYVEYWDSTAWRQIDTEAIATTPADNFQTTIYTGNSTARNITGTNFTPDLVWIKMYSTGASDHTLFDSLRGTNNLLQSNNTNGEQTFANTLTSFNSPPTGGFSLGTDFRVNNVYDYVAWQWRAGGAPSTTNSNAAGLAPTLGSVMIDDVQSTTALSGSLAATNITANTNLAFSIVTYTGTGSNETVDHGLGQTPSVIIVKNLGMVSADWIVGSNVIPPYDFNYHMNLNNNSFISGGTNFNNTNPTSTVFSVNGSDNTTGAAGNYVAYCFASAAGLSKIDFYAGNSGTQNIALGFTPGFVMIKSVSALSSWNIIDNKRPGGYTLYAEDLVGENDESSLVGLAGTGAAGEIQLKAASGNYNQSGREYLYMAFAG
tara:strand:- start:39 stop:1295 length:1257 start_codon:yes stop_codon:yes gene_type:complete